MDRFGVLILTHGRPDNVVTYDTLRRQGFTGDIFLVVDNEDSTVDGYLERYGDKVVIFDKEAVARTIDEGDNFSDRRVILYARNASFQIARDLGLDYFLQLDDDYTTFRYRFTSDLDYRDRGVKNLDAVFKAVLAYYETIPAVTLAMGQTGDFIGGQKGTAGKKLALSRKAMNTFFCRVGRPFEFFGRINEDVNAYVTLGNRGDLFLTTFQVIIQQKPTQGNTGGMTEIYLDQGTYIKSFYTVMYAPSCTTIASLGPTHPRLHHHINWKCAVPKIMSERYRMASGDPNA